MANTKKYISLDKLSLYDEKIKKVIADGDAAALASAKSYADNLAVNYDAAGSAATALSDAKAYADDKDSAIAAAQKAGDDAASAAAIADGKAVAAQNDVDALEAYVGTIPEGATATDLVGYVQERTSGIATSDNLQELTNRVAQAEADIDNIEKDYLKASDKEELADDIADVQTAVDAEKSRAEGVEAGLNSRLATIEGDYLKKTDKDELAEDIATNAAAIERLTNGVSAEEVDGVNDLIQYVKEHGTEVTGMQEDIADNAAAIAAEAERAKGEEAKNSAAAANALEVANNAQAAVDAEVERATGVEGGLDTRLKAVEAAVGESGSVADDIATAKQEAIDESAADATTKANAAETNAKAYADSLNTSMNTRVEALEAIDHDHVNKAELDLIVSGDKAKWDAAATKAHEHGNMEVLAGITAAKVSAWNAAESNAKTYADGLNTAMDARVVALETWHNNFTEVSEEEINALFA